jgi:hypothetical protein
MYFKQQHIIISPGKDSEESRSQYNLGAWWKQEVRDL